MEDNPYKAVFNFYEKITPPPRFSSFVEGWRTLGDFTENLDHYVGAQLHKNLDPKGLYPYVNFAVFKGSTERILTDMTQPDPALINALIEGHGLPGHQINYPGGYIEAATDNGERIAPDLTDKSESIVVIISFQVPDNSMNDKTEIESNWCDHSGINLLKEAIVKTGKKIGRYGLYKRFTPFEPFHSYMYVVRCELIGMDGKELELLEAVKMINEKPLPDGIIARNTGVYKIAEFSKGKHAK